MYFSLRLVFFWFNRIIKILTNNPITGINQAIKQSQATISMKTKLGFLRFAYQSASHIENQPMANGIIKAGRVLPIKPPTSAANKTNINAKHFDW